jgi:hypothetical protein
VKKLLCLIAICAAIQLDAQQPLDSQLRLKPGNYWIYAGTVAWSDVTTKTFSRSRKITWKTEILEEVSRGELKAYLVKGAFADLSWYEPGEKVGQYLWIVYKDRFYSLAMDPDLLRRFRDPEDSLISVVLEEEPIVQTPLQLNQCTVALHPEESDRQDMMYCWYMEDKGPRKLAAAKVAPGPFTVWTAWYRSNPEHHILGFAPGVGIISYDFSHHGSVSEAHVKLIEAHLQ